MTPTHWLKTLLSGQPHFIIGHPSRPYLLRWFLIPRNRFFNIYLHKFCRDDDDRALHDHPWASLSMLISGSYREITPAGSRLFHRGAIIPRKATHRHRVELIDGAPAWTLFLTGRTVREWGFWCPQGFVPWKRFTASDNSGAIGKGCDL